MMPENSVDAFAFWIVFGIFAFITGKLVYESLLTNWSDIFYVEEE